MSCVKLHLPIYNLDVLYKIKQLSKKNKDILPIFIENDISPKRTYMILCEKIFNNYHKKIVIFGEIQGITKEDKKYKVLPIPNASKIILDINNDDYIDYDINDNKGIEQIVSKYIKYGYEKYTTSQLLSNLDILIYQTLNRCTFGFKYNGEMFKGDTFYIWYQTKNNEIFELPLSNIIKYIFGGDSISAIEEVKLWRKVFIKDLMAPKNLEHYLRVKKADLSYPIIMFKYKNKNRKRTKHILLDGYHRIVKAYLDNVDNIKVMYATKEQLDKSDVDKLNHDALIL